jgi:hypothetical protein
MMIHPDFACWSHATLTQFANETYERVIEDMYEIDRLKQDLKVAINAYREVNKLRGEL